MEVSELKRILEGALLAAGRPLSVKEMANLFDDKGRPDNKVLREALKELAEECEDRAYELQEVGSGFRFQVKSKYGQWVSRLWEEKPPRYSRALLETLALVAYKQPITRGEIEDVRGVAVSTNIIRTLLERSWVRVVGHRDVPGKPAMYATTKEFLDYFNLKTLNQLPTLEEIKSIAQIQPDLVEEEPPTEGRVIEMPLEEDLDAEGNLVQSAADGEDDESGERDSRLSVTAATSADASEKDLSAEEVEAIVSNAEAVLTGERAAGESSETDVDDEEQVPSPDDVEPDANFDSLPN